MYIHIFIVSALLFFALSPGILFQFQTNISKYTIAFIHALFFGGLFVIIFKYYKESLLQEGAKGRQNRKKVKNFFKKVDKGPIKTIRKSSFANKLTKIGNCIGNHVGAMAKGINVEELAKVIVK